MYLFSFRDLDNHYQFRILGIKFAFRHKCKFKYVPVNEYGITTNKRNPQIIVSLTSFPARILTAHYSINTLLQQAFKPDRVILWLAKTQFPNLENDLPEDILRLKEFGLEIRWCEKDIKSYKKLIPSLKEFPNDIIVTADDDIYYEKDWLGSLYKKHHLFPKYIISQRIRNLAIKNDRIVTLSGNKSERLDYSTPKYLYQMFGGTGVLYPPKSLYHDIFNETSALKLLPTNDDVYFWAMAVLNRTKIAVAKGLKGDLYQMDLKESSLSRINNEIEKDKNKNPFQIIIQAYPEIFKILKEDK